MKSILLTVMAIVLNCTAWSQSIQSPAVSAWESLAAQTPAIFIETDSVLIAGGKGSFVGPVLYWLNDSLDFTNTTYPQLANIQTNIVDFIERPGGGFYFAIDFIDPVTNQHRMGVNSLSKFGVVLSEGLSPVMGNYESPAAMTLLPEGDVVIVGSGKLTANETSAAKAIRFSPEGQVVWEKNYATLSSSIYDIISTPQSVLFATGYITENEGVILPTDRVHAGFWMKLLPNGDTIATRKFGIREAVGHEIFLTPDQALFVVGEDRPGEGLQRLFLRKMDQEGNLLWEKNQPYRLADSASILDYRYRHSALTPDGGVVFVLSVSFQDPTVETHTYVAKVDENGEPQWSALYPSPIGKWNEARFILPLSTGGYVLTGTEQIEGELLLQTFYALLTNDGTVAIEPSVTMHPSLHVSPNPTSDLVFVQWTQHTPGEVQLTVRTLNGQVVITETTLAQAGKAELSVSLSHLPDGVYVLELSDSQYQSAFRIVKQGK